MAVLEKVIQMRNEGLPENEIIRNLQSEGITPKEINDALMQSKIKQAVSSEYSNQGMEQSMMSPGNRGDATNETEGDEYIPQAPSAPIAGQTPSPQQTPPEEYSPQTPYTTSPAAPQEQYLPEPRPPSEEYYPMDQEGYGGYGYPPEASSENYIEIAEQVFSEKIKKFQDQVEDLVEFKTLFKTKVENIEERLKRMEKMFDQLQISILEKIGDYGKGMKNLKKEVEMVEDSFSKIVNKTLDRHTSKK
ncbi:hypothetical protein B6U91_00400 [Candidatus Pacearchaeota archaeon ex4484_71]|nr:MAG: hypothetical protein B6U91_00400 [Candidatus Pacearchaeota archaeon ex4484_71]